MLDKLIDVLLQFIGLFKFWEVINDYEEGIVLRLGRFQRALSPGFHWIIPFAVDQVITDNVTTRTVNLSPQALTTKDGKQVVCSLIVRARIRDLRKALLETEGMDETLKDSTVAIAAERIMANDWDVVRQPEFAEQITAQARKLAFKYGIEVELVRFSDLSLTRNFTQTRIG